MFPKHREMFLLVSMYDVTLDLQALSLNVKADYLESNLEFLKELDRQLPDTTLSDTAIIIGADTIAGSSSCSFGDGIGIRSCKGFESSF